MEIEDFDPEKPDLGTQVVLDPEILGTKGNHHLAWATVQEILGQQSYFAEDDFVPESLHLHLGKQEVDGGQDHHHGHLHRNVVVVEEQQSNDPHQILEED
jgi:hypothetical protein